MLTKPRDEDPGVCGTGGGGDAGKGSNWLFAKLKDKRKLVSNRTKQLLRLPR